jgi:hypothetical protein
MAPENSNREAGREIKPCSPATATGLRGALFSSVGENWIIGVGEAEEELWCQNITLAS